MITLPVTVTGDHWINPQQVHLALSVSDPNETVVLDLCAEGPSLHSLGLVDLVIEHCEQTGRNPNTIYLSRWSNPVESTPFQLANRSSVSHFYWGAKRYWPNKAIPCQQGHLFGMFVGRPTLPRLALLRYLASTGNSLLSMMQGGQIPDAANGINLDYKKFGPSTDLLEWYTKCGLQSIDGSCIRDQYQLDKNTNQSLLSHYHRFHVEIVSESYIYGDTFFPTEKTVRPLAAGKPVIVMGPKHFLHRLREQGFRTWNDCWDETYDELEGPARLEAIKDVIQQLTSCTTNGHDFMIHADHNRENLSRLIEKHQPGT